MNGALTDFTVGRVKEVFMFGKQYIRRDPKQEMPLPSEVTDSDGGKERVKVSTVVGIALLAVLAILLVAFLAVLSIYETEALVGMLPEWIPEGVTEWLSEFSTDYRLNFIKGNRWKMLLKGLLVTLEITFFAVLIGILIGVLVASVRSSYDKNREALEKRGGFGYHLMKILNGICNVYLTVFRGTPVVVQLLIMYFVIFKFSNNGTLISIIAFGINSGAYVAEIFRSGIMSIDNGQFEAGRAMGFNYVQTMFYIIIPQMFKVVLPTLCNEFIVLLKETSIAGYVGIEDLTKVGDLIRGRTFSAFMPLLAVALIYLVLVVVLTQLVKLLERRLRRSER